MGSSKTLKPLNTFWQTSDHRTKITRGVGIQALKKDNHAPTSERFRTLVYSTLSDVADVHVTDYNKDRVHIMLLGMFHGCW